MQLNILIKASAWIIKLRNHLVELRVRWNKIKNLKGIYKCFLSLVRSI